MTIAITVFYVACFQCAGIPSIVRVLRRRSSADLSLWREKLLLMGIAGQLAVMGLTHAAWPLVAGAVASALSIGTLLIVALRHR